MVPGRSIEWVGASTGATAVGARQRTADLNGRQKSAILRLYQGSRGPPLATTPCPVYRGQGTVDMKNTLAEIKQAKRVDHPDDTDHAGDGQDQAHIPGLGPVLVMDVVISNRQDGAVVEQRQHHDHHR